jgi:hypothetical protein
MQEREREALWRVIVDAKYGSSWDEWGGVMEKYQE